MIRLDKYLADTGAASRREAKAYIRRGEVTVDGVPARAPEQKIAETAVVCLRGQVLRYQAYHYYMLHKPAGVLTATADRSQPTVLDLFPPELRRFGLVPAGRLDKDTTGHGRRRLCPPRHHAKKARAEGLFCTHGWAADGCGYRAFRAGRRPRRRDAVPARPARAPAGAGGLPRHGL